MAMLIPTYYGISDSDGQMGVLDFVCWDLDRVIGFNSYLMNLSFKFCKDPSFR